MLPLRELKFDKLSTTVGLLSCPNFVPKLSGNIGVLSHCEDHSKAAVSNELIKISQLELASDNFTMLSFLGCEAKSKLCTCSSLDISNNTEIMSGEQQSENFVNSRRGSGRRS